MAAVQDFIPFSVDFIPLSVDFIPLSEPKLAKHQSIFPRLGNNLHRKRPSPVALEIDEIVSHHAKKLRIEFEEKLREKDLEIRRLGRLKLALEKRVESLYEENQLLREDASTLACPAVEEDAESCC